MVYDLIIIGADSAGLTAGIYAGRKKLSTAIITKQVGGQSILTNRIENFPGFDFIVGKDLIQKMRLQAEKHRVEIKEGIEVESIEKKDENFFIKSKNGDFESRSIIISTGKVQRRLNIPGENEFENKGLSFCSICDAPFYGGKDVVVVGGGNSGLESAVDLLEYANKIYILEYDSKLKGDEVWQEKLKKTEKVDFITEAEIKEIKGNVFVEKIIYKDRKNNEIKEIPVGGVFISIGWNPATGFLKDFVDLNEYREIKIDPKTNETSIKGIFAAGDVTEIKYKQNIVAAAEGAKAALSAYEYLVK